MRIFQINSALLEMFLNHVMLMHLTCLDFRIKVLCFKKVQCYDQQYTVSYVGHLIVPL